MEIENPDAAILKVVYNTLAPPHSKKNSRVCTDSRYFVCDAIRSGVSRHDKVATS